MNYQHKVNKVIIYTLNDCIYCFLTKKLLEDNNIEYKEINLNKNLNLFDEMKKKYKHNMI